MDLLCYLIYVCFLLNKIKVFELSILQFIVEREGMEAELFYL